MAKHGQLKKSQYGFTMPVTAPAVQSPPFYYRNMEMIIVEYRTDEEEALRLLPDGLELAEPATASLVIAKYHFSTFGPYNEAILGVGCKWKGELMSFLPNLFVTQEAPLIAGRSSAPPRSGPPHAPRSCRRAARQPPARYSRVRRGPRGRASAGRRVA